MADRGPIGAALARREDERVLRGATRFLDDLERPGMVHAAFVRSPHAHAGLPALRIPGPPPGAVAAYAAADLAPLARFPLTTPRDAELDEAEAHPVLAGEEVRYAGQPVAIVLADSRAQAEDAVELIEVDYEVRDPVTDVHASETMLMRWAARAGDVAQAFARAAHVVEGRYALPRLIAAPMETRGALAEHDPESGLLTIWCSAQDTHRPREQLAHILGREPASIRVIVPDVGGAFGSKGVIAPEVAAVAAAAVALGRPVKWTEDRLENLVGTYQGRGIEGELALALDADGRMLGLRARLCADLGGYLLTTTAIPPHTAGTLILGVYDIPAADVSVHGMQTHRVPTGPYRGAGRPDAAYMLEALVDQAARVTGIDRIELRRRNLVRSFPHPTATGLEYDSGDYERCLDLALELAGPAPAPRAGRVSGRGVALYVERAGGAFESAAVTLQDGGRFLIDASSSPHGQGHDITFAQIAADRLGVGVEQIALRFGDSASTPPGVGTFGSRSVAQAGSAVARAAEAMVQAGRAAAAESLGVSDADLELEPGGFTAAGGRGLGWAELAASREEEPLRVEARFASANVFSSGAYVADVSIDPATGELQIPRLVAVDDAGTLINPLLVHGQVIGGAVQALGECLTEEALYDDAGQPRAGSFLDYGLLTAAEIPPIVTGEIETPSPLNPLGAKGAGEGGAVGTLPAVANAVADALGGRVVAPPFSAEVLWRALQEPVASAPSQVAAAQPAPAPRAGRGPLAAVAALAVAAVVVVIARGRRR